MGRSTEFSWVKKTYVVGKHWAELSSQYKEFGLLKEFDFIKCKHGWQLNNFTQTTKNLLFGLGKVTQITCGTQKWNMLVCNLQGIPSAEL